MVNKTLLPALQIAFKSSKPLKQKPFQVWHGFRCYLGEPRLGRARRLDRIRKVQAWEGKARGSFRGE
jgi:hypothetical protein